MAMYPFCTHLPKIFYDGDFRKFPPRHKQLCLQAIITSLQQIQMDARLPVVLILLVSRSQVKYKCYSTLFRFTYRYNVDPVTVSADNTVLACYNQSITITASAHGGNGESYYFTWTDASNQVFTSLNFPASSPLFLLNLRAPQMPLKLMCLLGYTL